MKWKTIITFCLIIVYAVLFGCTSIAEFKSLDTKLNGEQQTLKGELTKPSGDGPFPAIVLLHGCSGPQPHYSEWIGRLQRWGYVSLMVNSFGPRGKSNICAPGKGHIIQPSRRAKDAYGAKLYLESLPFVDPNRIAVMGWSHGGMAVIEAVQINEPSSKPFKAAISYYPRCTRLYILNSPLLVLIGEKDDWTPARLCKYYIKPKKGWPEIILKVYPAAHHAFDQPFMLNYYMGHQVGYNPAAAVDSFKMVRVFLEKYLVDK